MYNLQYDVDNITYLIINIYEWIYNTMCDLYRTKRNNITMLDDQPRQYWIYANTDNELAHKSGIVSHKSKIQYLVIHAPSPSTWGW